MSMNKSEDFKSATDEKFTSKEKDILEKNKKFFSADRKYVQAMLDIIDGNSDISIRVLDWFVANYSKKNNTTYKTKVNGVDSLFNVNIEYKNQLNGYSKQYFDPFCRKKKVIYTYRATDGGKEINFVSSIGQLNFFQWAIRNKVIKYVQMHLKEIEEDMKETSRLNKEKKLAALASASNESDSDDDNQRNDDPDPIICSSDKINSVHISPARKSSNSKSDSESRSRRQQLSKSVYDYGIKKSNVPIKLDFE
ncbi:mg368 protein [Tupanvirus deep ocean]|uniref:Mg368 protein n=2 Tax=Tupanvirus TaxID=2094720 RepID=A0AC62A8Z1_9VIRU|nr:mg368 protein [Tupanvirus deep ocean]QKU34235.1 mg368 protein [Tupanvirus deep ocean]